MTAAVSNTSARRVVLLIVMAMVLASAWVVAAPPQEAQAETTVSKIRNSIERRVNRARDARDLRDLKVSDTIQKWAQDHAGDMASLTSIFHDPPGELKHELFKLDPNPWYWGENVAYMWCLADEPLECAKDVHKEFMGSKDHKANILKQRYTHMGIGVVKRGNFVYVVQRFADRTK